MTIDIHDKMVFGMVSSYIMNYIYIIIHVMLWHDCWVVTSFTDKKNIAL